MCHANRLLVVSDISCDVNGSIEFLDRTCTIAQPFFQYNPLTQEEVCADIGEKGITVMGKMCGLQTLVTRTGQLTSCLCF